MTNTPPSEAATHIRYHSILIAKARGAQTGKPLDPRREWQGLADTFTGKQNDQPRA